MRLPTSHRPNYRRAGRAAWGLAFPIIVTVLLLPWQGGFANTTVAAMSFLLGVLSATLLGGLAAGMTASVAAFLALNFFFTPPFHTFEVDKPEDLFSLVAFLVISGVVANLFTQLVRQKQRAQRRERESTLLNHVATRFLRHPGTGGVLTEVAQELVDLFGLSACEVMLMDGQEIAETTIVIGERSENTHDIPMKTERGSYGSVRLSSKADRPLNPRDEELARSVVSQLALALEANDLHAKAMSAQADAESSRIRAALFSSVTHDLRTPLSSIKASATSLLEEGVEFSEVQRSELLRTIAEESDRLNRLIGNLLDLSRLRAGALVPEKQLTAIEDVIDSVIARYRARLDGRTVNVRVRESLPPVPMDLIQIDQVLTNLIENAMRYSEPASPLEVRAARWHNTVEVSVADRGSGIAAQERELVFDEFYRGSEGRERSDGAGLGLSIARAIVEAHGGSIWIHDTPGGGTTVAFRLPLAGAEQ